MASVHPWARRWYRYRWAGSEHGHLGRTSMASVTPSLANPTTMPEPRSWIERLWSSVADRGRSYAEVLQPQASKAPLDRARELASALLSERGEASGAAVARELHTALREFGPADRVSFYRFLVQNFLPAEDQLRAAAEAYLAEPTPERANQLAQAAEPTRQELLRRMNMVPGGTAALVAMRKDLLAHLRGEPDLKPLESDLRHLLGSWFNRGFLELQRIDWQTPAAVLEERIAYEAVDEIKERTADTALCYSLSNCQEGLRGVSFGNFLIKQVVEELKVELPRVMHFSTLSPVPGFSRWLKKRLAAGEAAELLLEGELSALRQAVKETAPERDAITLLRGLLETERWWEDAALADALRDPLTRLCAVYLTTSPDSRGPADSVARFHLGNGARLERVNWLGNVAARGINESYGIMVNYLYDREQIAANKEAFVRGAIVRSAAVDALLGSPAPAATVRSQSQRRTRRPRKR